MIILASLIAIYLLVLFIGKYVRKVNYLGYLFIGILTVIQVAMVLYFLFNMEVPQP